MRDTGDSNEWQFVKRLQVLANRISISEGYRDRIFNTPAK